MSLSIEHQIDELEPDYERFLLEVFSSSLSNNFTENYSDPVLEIFTDSDFEVLSDLIEKKMPDKKIHLEKFAEKRNFAKNFQENQIFLLKNWISDEKLFLDGNFVRIFLGIPPILTPQIFWEISKNSENLPENWIINLSDFLEFYEKFSKMNYFEKIFFLLQKNKKNFLDFFDLKNLAENVLKFHPSLNFLNETPEFKKPFIESVAARIIYFYDENFTRKILLRKMKNKKLIYNLFLISFSEDINLSPFFSYKQFYILYSSAWKLGFIKSLELDPRSLYRYDNSLINDLIVERILGGFGTKNLKLNSSISFEEFIYFMISIEDLNSLTAINYFFNLLDFFGDGKIYFSEIFRFYENLEKKLKKINSEFFNFEIYKKILIDLISPKNLNYFEKNEIIKSGLFEEFFSLIISGERAIFFILNNSQKNRKFGTGKKWNEFCERKFNNI